MLGEKIGEFRGKVTGQRMLPSDGLPKFETTAEGAGTIIGIPARVMATYWSAMQPDGSLYGETVGPSPTITKDGDMRGAVFYQGATGKLSRLNGLALVFEWDVDEHGHGVLGLWEWK